MRRPPAKPSVPSRAARGPGRGVAVMGRAGVVGAAATLCFRRFAPDPVDSGPAPGLEPPQRRGGAMRSIEAKYTLGEVVRHRSHPFRGVIFDVDPEFANSEEWYQAIPPGARPRRDQPFYHLLAENAQSYYVAYVSEQNLLPDHSGEPVTHPDIGDLFGAFDGRQYPLHFDLN